MEYAGSSVAFSQRVLSGALVRVPYEVAVAGHSRQGPRWALLCLPCRDVLTRLDEPSHFPHPSVEGTLLPTLCLLPGALAQVLVEPILLTPLRALRAVVPAGTATAAQARPQGA